MYPFRMNPDEETSDEETEVESEGMSPVTIGVIVVGVLAAAGGGYWYYTKKQEEAAAEAAAAEAARVAQVTQTLKTTAFQPSASPTGSLKKATGRGALASGAKTMPTIADLKATTA